MGWLFTQDATRQDVIDELVAPYENVDSRTDTLGHSARGNQLWVVREQTDKATGLKQRYIMLNLLGFNKGYGWGYKNMDEGMHPYFYNCPLKFLDMVPVANEEWREKVRQYHTRKNHNTALKRSLKVGDKVTLKPGCKVRVVELLSLKPLVGQCDGQRYRLSVTLIDRVG